MRMTDQAGDAFLRHLALQYALASVRGDQSGQSQALIRLAGRPQSRTKSFIVTRRAIDMIVDQIPGVLGGGEDFTRDTLIDALQAELDALEVRCPGLAVEGAW